MVGKQLFTDGPIEGRQMRRQRPVSLDNEQIVPLIKNDKKDLSPDLRSNIEKMA